MPSSGKQNDTQKLAKASEKIINTINLVTMGKDGENTRTSLLAQRACSLVFSKLLTLYKKGGEKKKEKKKEEKKEK